jgi:hypothetical protein
MGVFREERWPEREGVKPWAIYGAVVLSAFVIMPAAAGSGPSAEPTAVAYVGCSISTQAVRGYELEGGVGMWSPPSAFDGQGQIGVYPGGTPLLWSMALDRPDLLPYWREFDEMQAARPARAVWWQVCVRRDDPLPESLSAAQRVLGEVHRRIPGATVYVSAVPEYEVPTEVLGAAGAERAQAIADALVTRGLAEVGPTLPEIEPRHLLPDATHFNEAGERLHGLVLLSFFGAGAESIVMPRTVAA